MKTDHLQSCGHCWVFQICWHIECSTFTASSFRIFNSSAGIPWPLLALFIVTIPKVHLTLYSRMCDSRWVIIPSWLSRSLRLFLYSSSLYSLVTQMVKQLPAMQENRVWSLGWEDPLEKEMATQYSCLGNPKDGGAWQTTVYGVSKSQTWLNDFTFFLYIPATSSKDFLFLLGPYHFCHLLCPSLPEMLPWYLSFSWKDL